MKKTALTVLLLLVVLPTTTVHGLALTGDEHYTTTQIVSGITVDALPNTFYIGEEESDVKVTLTTSSAAAVTSWGSTRLTLEGRDDVCINHGNHPISKSQTYEEVLTFEPPATVGQYDILIQLFVTDDCETELGVEVLRAVDVRKKITCLNCISSSDDVQVSKEGSEEVTTPAITNDDDALVRQERKRKIDAFMKMYENDPNHSDIVILIRLLIALDIIQI